MRYLDALLRAVGALALVAIAFPSVLPSASAQYNPRINDRVLGQTGGLPQGISRVGNVWQFDTSSGAPAAVMFGILTPPMKQPLTPEQSGRGWVWCEGPASAFECSIRINVAGNLLEFPAVWSLQ